MAYTLSLHHPITLLPSLSLSPTGYIVAMAPAESYLDPTTSRFDRLVNILSYLPHAHDTPIASIYLDPTTSRFDRLILVNHTLMTRL